MSVCLVTGANRGIGLELVRQLVERGDAVIGVCRKASPELEALNCRIIDGMDVADADGVARLREDHGLTIVEVLRPRQPRSLQPRWF